SEIEILAVISPVSRFVVVLKPVRADDEWDSQQSLERVAKSRGAFLLRGHHRIDAVIVLVATAVFAGGHIELADENRLAGQRMKRFEIKPGEADVVPMSVEIAGHGVHIGSASAGHVEIIKRQHYIV